VGSESRIVELLTKNYGVEADRISPEARLADLGLDSLTMTELLFDVEDALGIEIPTDTPIETFADFVAVADRLVAAKGS
jgi:acyl carrier protein